MKGLELMKIKFMFPIKPFCISIRKKYIGIKTFLLKVIIRRGYNFFREILEMVIDIFPNLEFQWKPIRVVQKY